jgi:hypothetical protein
MRAPPLPSPNLNPQRRSPRRYIPMTGQNCDWGYRRIQAALSNLGHKIARSMTADILERQGIEPAADAVSLQESIPSVTAVFPPDSHRESARARPFKMSLRYRLVFRFCR